MLSGTLYMQTGVIRRDAVEFFSKVLYGKIFSSVEKKKEVSPTLVFELLPHGWEKHNGRKMEEYFEYVLNEYAMV